MRLRNRASGAKVAEFTPFSQLRSVREGKDARCPPRYMQVHRAS